MMLAIKKRCKSNYILRAKIKLLEEVIGQAVSAEADCWSTAASSTSFVISANCDETPPPWSCLHFSAIRRDHCLWLLGSLIPFLSSALSLATVGCATRPLAPPSYLTTIQGHKIPSRSGNCFQPHLLPMFLVGPLFLSAVSPSHLSFHTLMLSCLTMTCLFPPISSPPF